MLRSKLLTALPRFGSIFGHEGMPRDINDFLVEVVLLVLKEVKT